MTKIRIMVVEPEKAPRVVETAGVSWTTWYPLIDSTTHLLETLPIAPQIDMLFDEDGRRKKMPVNILVPARAPAALMEGTFIIDMTKGKGMLPGESGIGYHQILGTFILARRRGNKYVSLTDKDIVDLTKAVGRG